MAVYMITYDLNKQGKDYEDVYKAIKDASDGTWCHYWDSTWIIRSNLSVQQVSDKITPYLDSDDSMIAIEVINNKQGWLTKKQWDYINNQIFA